MRSSEMTEEPLPSGGSSDAFEQTLAGLYGDVVWSQEEKDFLRASGLI